MAEYKLKHTGAVINQQIDRVLDGSVVADNTLSALDLESKKPVDSGAVANFVKPYKMTLLRERISNYTKYADGELGVTGSYFTTFEAIVKGLQYLKVEVCHTDNVSASIAFYDEDFNYLQSASVQGKVGYNKYETNVPNEAVFARFTHRNDKGYDANLYALSGVGLPLSLMMYKISSPPETSGYFIRYSDGSMLNTASPYSIYKTNVKGLNDIEFNVYHTDTASAAIAFFEESGAYIKSFSVQAKAGYNRYYAVIPSNAAYAIFTHRTDSDYEVAAYTHNGAEAVHIEVESVKAGMEDLIIASRKSSVVSSSINAKTSLDGYAIGTKFCLDLTKVVNGTIIILEGKNGVIGYVPLYSNGISPIYLEQDGNLKSINIYKSAAEGNDLAYTLSVVKEVSLSNMLQPIYVPTNKRQLVLGELESGFFTDENNKAVDRTWCVYPMQFSNGFTIKVHCSDWDTYYVTIGKRGYMFTSNNEVRLTSDNNEVDLRGVWAWTLQFRRIDRAVIVPEEVSSVISVEIVDGIICERPAYHIDVKECARRIGNIEDVVNIPTYNPFRNAPYYAHIAVNSFVKDGNGNDAIASQSLDDVAMSARLGYSFIEANIHKNASGDYICIHGNPTSSGQVFGAEVYSLDGSDAANMVISQTTTDYMKSNIRYNSDLPKYRTTVPTLQEFLQCCKEHNIGIFAGTSSQEAIEMCIKYLGEDNVIVYNPPTNIREFFNGYVFTWESDTTSPETSLLAKANQYGRPYLCGIDPKVLAALKDNGTLDGVIKDMHANGYLIGVAATYQTEADVRDAFRRGIDFAAAGNEVNPFTPSYECIDLDGADSNYSTNGVVSDNVLTLASGQTFECGGSEIIALGKGELSMRFNGSITVQFGSRATRSITSVGNEDVVITDYFFKRATKLIITATSSTTIMRLCYNTSKC